MKVDHLSSKEIWQKHLQLEGLHNAHQKHRVFSFIAMAVTAIVVFIILITANFRTYPILLTATLTFALIGMSVALFLYFKTKDLTKTTLISSIVILILVFLLTYTGGNENTALYWLMFSPLAAYSIFGIYFGSILTLSLVSYILFLLYGPDIGQTIYGATEKSRFFASYCVVILFAFINEFFRDKSFATINSISLEQRKKANSDSLSGLPNRRFIDSFLLPKITTKQENFLPMSLIMADIDEFKIINDTYGHDIGDAAIIHVAQLFKNQIRNSDVVARYGGEEFLIFLPKATHIKALEVAEKIRCSLTNSPLTINKQIISFTCSFGVAEVNDIVPFDQALKQADEKLYQAKNSGKNKVVG
ncbi:GGDEF domain-containing protein [Thalassotalea profundi]|uniref:diguanylate cyclase n=1 Tax=Thalassotalea profundi TaxID=2036687 RepID=A0ABQ3INY1_9GAMM|nr:GGDEF domain-containing protein [Thalassotalea profundi]GHE89152.1 hypothetical protein GCM10011501_18300 [Thalassotalea profundi]